MTIFGICLVIAAGIWWFLTPTRDEEEETPRPQGPREVWDGPDFVGYIR